MMKMLIRLDEDKILREKKYNLTKINDYLTSSFEERHMKKDSTGWYTNGTFVSCGSLILALSESAWFMNNLIEWLWYDESDDSIDDLKEFYLKERHFA